MSFDHRWKVYAANLGTPENGQRHTPLKLVQGLILWSFKATICKLVNLQCFFYSILDAIQKRRFLPTALHGVPIQLSPEYVGSKTTKFYYFPDDYKRECKLCPRFFDANCKKHKSVLETTTER
ncbi:UNVERIFIED_CONTAM: hypothetical protein K2H54_007367 [Gekko kuhli]